MKELQIKIEYNVCFGDLVRAYEEVETKIMQCQKLGIEVDFEFTRSNILEVLRNMYWHNGTSIFWSRDLLTQDAIEKVKQLFPELVEES